MKTSDSLELYTVYERPKDYPDHYVVRRSVIYRGVIEQDSATILCGCLAEARHVIPEDKVRFERDPADDPCIVEVWL